MLPWAVIWRVLVVAYAIYNLGGTPGAAEGWEDVFQPLGAGRLIGLVLLIVIIVSLLPREWRASQWLKAKHAFGVPHKQKSPQAPSRHDPWAVARQMQDDYHEGRQAAVERARDDLEDFHRAVAEAIEEARGLGGSDEITEALYSAHMEWRRRTAKFIESALGVAKRQLFVGNEAKVDIDADIAVLEGLLTDVQVSDLKLSGDALSKAIEDRDSGSLEGDERTLHEIARAPLGPVSSGQGSLSALEREYTEGDRMLKASGPFTSPLLHGASPSDQDIDAWKLRVLNALPASKRREFRFAPLQAERFQIFRRGLVTFESDRSRRLKKHMEALERIMEGMDQP